MVVDRRTDEHHKTLDRCADPACRGGLTIGGKSLREHFEVINHVDAIQHLKSVAEKKQDLSESVILRIHRDVLSRIDEKEAGMYRRHNVRIMGADHIPPAATRIRRFMKELMTWYHEKSEAMWPPELAALLHYQLVHIHPFMDGNGRTARLLMNFVLMRHGYPPAVILNVDRKKYYRVLMEADRETMEPFVDFVGRAVNRSLIIYLNAIMPSTETPDERGGYMTLREAADLCSYSQEYLSFLARTGRLEAVKFGRTWMTSREALNEYVESHGQDQ
jgi:excisionase family DNA binding protein